MSGWYPAPALAQLRREVDALWPLRDRSSDGMVGDTSHQARPSDHNPDYAAGGIVRAWDCDEDLTPGGSVVGKASGLVAQLIRDPRVAYVIYEGRIWQNPAVFTRGGWQPYSGPNAHAHHVHVSVRRGSTWDSDSRTWGVARTASAASGSGSGLGFGIPGPVAPIVLEEDTMLVLARQKGDPAVYVGDGITRRHVKTDAGLKRLQFLIREGFYKAKSPDVQVWDDLDDLGREV